jgi:hypothetical protein
MHTRSGQLGRVEANGLKIIQTPSGLKRRVLVYKVAIYNSVPAVLIKYFNTHINIKIRIANYIAPDCD